MNGNGDLWQERFRPKHVKDVILPGRVRKILNKVLESGDLPHFLFYYPRPGNGKTSLAKAICFDVGIDEYLYINASINGKIGFIRDEIEPFAATRALTGPFKAVIFDEMENSSAEFQEALKSFIEEHGDYVKFFIITNNINKIIKPLISRTNKIPFDFEIEEVKSEMVPMVVFRLCDNLDMMGVSYKKDVVSKLVETLYPDIRSMYTSLQMEYMENGSITETVSGRVFIDASFYDLIINKKFSDTMGYLTKNGCNYGEMYGKMFREFIPLIPNKSKPNTIITLAKYQDMHARSLDPELNYASCVVEIMRGLSI